MASSADPASLAISRTSAMTSDSGSVTPLVLGMALCLLMLVGGITAVGSLFLDRQRLQTICDGTALAAANAAGPAGYATDRNAALSKADEYLRLHWDNVRATVEVGDQRAVAQCGRTMTVTAIWAFEIDTVDVEVTSASDLLRSAR
jgi:Flp pilus assembly protein TadG